jgi:hypothetical protein
MPSQTIEFAYFCNFIQATLLLELRYRSPLEGEDDSDDDPEENEEDEEDFVPNVGPVTRRHQKATSALDSEDDGNALISLEENIANLEKSILATNSLNHSPNPQVRFANTSNLTSSIRRSSSLNADEYGSSGLNTKRKRTFNFPNAKKRYTLIYFSKK